MEEYFKQNSLKPIIYIQSVESAGASDLQDADTSLLEPGEELGSNRAGLTPTAPNWAMCLRGPALELSAFTFNNIGINNIVQAKPFLSRTSAV
jgi:hypothetical protein